MTLSNGNGREPRTTERILDEYLAAAARTGDRAAWERLVARWQPRLFRHAWRLTGHAELARDMVQEARGLPWRQKLAVLFGKPAGPGGA